MEKKNIKTNKELWPPRYKNTYNTSEEFREEEDDLKTEHI